MSCNYSNTAVSPISKNKSPCPQLPGTVLRIFIPAGAVINLLNIIELASPSGICIIVRLPFLSGDHKNGSGLLGFVNSVRNAGGTVEFLKK
ncbi:MAG: hypothetical protein GYA02_08670 [Clostridiaceae bacterium]|jgi:hypothetical protein|nr:hypothetical protein [Clostridiaceae bacterium]